MSRHSMIAGWLRRLHPQGWLLVLCLGLLLLSSCAEEKTTAAKAGTEDCVGCHTDKDLLIATAEPDTTEPGEDPGEG